MLRIPNALRTGDRSPFFWGLMALLWAVAGCAGQASFDVQSPPGTTTTYILVRHAEKLNQEADSPLSAKGRLRARDLADAVAPLGVSAIYCTRVKRNLETVQPVADRLGIEVIALYKPAPLNTCQLAEQFVRERLSTHGVGVILWVGNASDLGDWASNLQQIYRRLGGTGDGPRRYDDFFIVTLSDRGRVEVRRRHYGSPPD